MRPIDASGEQMRPLLNDTREGQHYPVAELHGKIMQHLPASRAGPSTIRIWRDQ